MSDIEWFVTGQSGPGTTVVTMTDWERFVRVPVYPEVARLFDGSSWLALFARMVARWEREFGPLR